MNTSVMTVALLAALAATAPVAQEKTGSKGGLTRVTRDDARAEDPSFDREAWRKDLTTGDLEERERAFDRLADAARRSRAAREALEEWSKEGNSELSWTSRLLLRDLRRRPHVLQFGNGQDWKGFDWDGLDMDFDFQDFGRRFEDLDSMLGDLREQWDSLLQQSVPDPSTGSGSVSESHQISLQSGPDGVTCKVTEKVDGKEETKTYEAKSMEELLEAHPELRGKLGGGSGLRFHTFHPQGWSMTLPRRNVLRLAPRMELRSGDPDRPGLFDSFGPFGTGPDGEPRTDRLGIGCSVVDDGLEVETVYPGSIASYIGLRPGDVLVEVNETAIHETGDVRKALAERAAQDDVSVVVLGRDGDRRTLTWKPNADTGAKESESESKDF